MFAFKSTQNLSGMIANDEPFPGRLGKGLARRNPARDIGINLFVNIVWWPTWLTRKVTLFHVMLLSNEIVSGSQDRLGRPNWRAQAPPIAAFDECDAKR